MTRVLSVVVLGVIAVAAPATRVYAHHSGTMFDDKKQVTLKGVVK
jgi:hypothetical protein